METTRNKQEIRGVVVSDKMNKTRVIQTERMTRHGLYQKGIMRTYRLFVHDEKNESKMGDVVIAISSGSRLSRHKNFRLAKIVEKKVVQ